MSDIQAEIKKEGANFTPEGWDWRYYFEKAKKAKFSLDENEVRPYLELNNVREGAFYVANRLYGITSPKLKTFRNRMKRHRLLSVKIKTEPSWCAVYGLFPS